MRDEDEFWMVWSPQGGAPTFRHSTEFLADGEAQRLARAAAGRSFYVLRAVRRYERTDVMRTELKEAHPF